METITLSIDRFDNQVESKKEKDGTVKPQVFAETITKFVLEKKYTVKAVENPNDPPDLIFEKDGKCIGVEVICLYDQIKIGNDKISEKGLKKEVEIGIVNRVHARLIQDDSIVYPDEKRFRINPDIHAIKFGEIDCHEDFKGMKDEIVSLLYEKVKDYFAVKGYLSNPYGWSFRLIARKGLVIPFVIYPVPDKECSKEDVFIEYTDWDFGGGRIGDGTLEFKGPIKEKAQKINAKKAEAETWPYNELWLYIQDRKDETRDRSAGWFSFFLSTPRSKRKNRKNNLRWQKELSQEQLNHPFSKVVVFNNLQSPDRNDEKTSITVNELTIYDKEVAIFDPKDFWSEEKLLEISSDELREILSKEKYRSVKVQDHLEIIGDRLLDFMKDDKAIDPYSLKKINKIAKYMLARLEDLEDESFFANHNTTFCNPFVVPFFETPSVRRDTCSSLVHSASRWQELEKNTSSGIPKAEYLSLFSEAIKSGSKNKKIALSYFLENFGFIHHFDETWAEKNLVEYFGKKNALHEFAWTCYLGGRIDGKYVPEFLHENFLEVAKNLNEYEVRFQAKFLRSFVFNLCLNSNVDDPEFWLSNLFQHQDNAKMRKEFCQEVEILLLQIRKEDQKDILEDCWKGWIKKYWQDRLASGDIDDGEGKEIFNWVFAVKNAKAISMALKMKPYAPKDTLRWNQLDDKFIAEYPKDVADLFLKVYESDFIHEMRRDLAYNWIINEVQEIIDRLLTYNQEREKELGQVRKELSKV
ncbi:MAG: hypothetical protein OXB88_07650 [Bacteriovoracales bacterium]|nr:hypothetical protein [Bacteriovoracales bacterium]